MSHLHKSFSIPETAELLGFLVQVAFDPFAHRAVDGDSAGRVELGQATRGRRDGLPKTR